MHHRRPACCLQQRIEDMRGEITGLQIHRHAMVPVSRAGILDGAVGLLAGRIDQRVQDFGFACNLPGPAADRILVSHIHLMQGDIEPLAGGKRRSLVVQPGINAGQEHPRAGSRQMQRRAKANAAASRDRGDLASEIRHHADPPCRYVSDATARSTPRNSASPLSRPMAE